MLARISDPAREKVFKKFGLKTVCLGIFCASVAITVSAYQKIVGHFALHNASAVCDFRTFYYKPVFSVSSSIV